MWRILSKFLLKLWGFKSIFDFPIEEIPKKYIMIVVPHTSAWDFPLGILMRTVWGLKIKYVGKASMFNHPFGWLLKWMGGIPVDRSKRNNFVDAVVDIFNEREELAIQIAPEGTRKRVEKFKTGFYYIAKGANVPILLCAFDFKVKEVRISKPFYPTDDMEADMEYIHNYYRGIQGYHPEKSFL